MIVLIEGPDGSGKSTLADEFVKRGFEYRHYSKMENVDAEYKVIIDQLINDRKRGRSVVIDRLFFSNMVYQKVFNDGAIVSDELKDQVRDLIDCYIFCIPSNKEKYLETFESLKKEREEAYDTMEDVYDAFDDLMNEDTDEYLGDKDLWVYDMYSIPKDQVASFVNNLL